MRALNLLLLAVANLMSLSTIAQDLAQSPWHIQTNKVDPARYFGITAANGMIGMVSSPDPLRVKDVVLNGVYDHYQRGRVSNILKVFNHVNMNLDVNGQRISRNNIQQFTQTLDMKQATFTTTFDVGADVSVKHTLIALRHLPFSSLQVVEIKANKACTITPASVIEAPDHLTEVKQTYAEIDRPHIIIPLITSTAKSPSGKYTLAASNSFIFQEKHGAEPDLIHEEWDYNMHLVKFHKTLKAGETYRFSIVSSVISSGHCADPVNEAERLSIFAALEKTDRLLDRHLKAWEKLWQSDVVIDGPMEEQRSVRSALYHLYAFAREGTPYSLSPMGLSGLGYNGHVFWDTELWMYPPLLMLQPEIAKSLLEYRFQRMDAARQNALMHGYDGLMFPWESSESGGEDTPVWALTGPFQQHITGTVAYAFWKYYQVTGDKVWLKERGWPVLSGAAAFWASRVERNGPGKFDIKNVIGANEWQENIDNNAFTNGMVKTVMGYAIQAAKELGMAPDPDWQVVADNIPILKFPDGTTRENATYDGVTIKQADVNLLAYPLQIVKGETAIKKDLEYYEPRMAKDGPAMGNAILSVLWSRLGQPEKAYELFVKSFKPNEVPPFGVLAETAGGTNPYFATGAGGLLQTVINGFGGLEITDQGIQQLKTSLPKNWKKLTITGVGKQEVTFTVGK